VDTIALLITILERDVVARNIVIDGWQDRSAGTISLKSLLGANDFDISERIIRVFTPALVETPSILVQGLDDSQNNLAPGFAQNRANRGSIQITCLADDGESAIGIANRVQGLYREPIPLDLQIYDRVYDLDQSSREEPYENETQTFRIVMRYSFKTIKV